MALRQYIDHLEHANSLYSLVHESFELYYHQHRGVTQADMNMMVVMHRSRGQDSLADALSQVLLLGEGSSTLVVNPHDSPHTELSKMLVVYARRDNQTYDVLVAKASQKKRIAPEKIACAVGGSLAVGGLGAVILTAASVQNPLSWGLGVAGTLATASAGKAAYDYGGTMENVVAGYICKELLDMGMIKLFHDHIVMV
eukprot:CAMPEP_0172677154 /NCGR_PEP_ID=MMETSP1074-20121228/14474_1 /TAXON_ID=2916 /ORGANISM="Ceratium fusus, Strain PA161109" /LENGTH=197 /DNA_ID=CAMNT_0013494939 /DNA_START=64 /DNA_END=657 /DNA_ORIENTATION=-